MKCTITNCEHEAVELIKYRSDCGKEVSKLYCEVHNNFPTFYTTNDPRVVYHRVGPVKHPYQEEKEKHLEKALGMTYAEVQEKRNDIVTTVKKLAPMFEDAPEKPPVPDYVPLVDIEDTKALYTRQPHYEGGIDPITFGMDNLSPEEMNGFYKLNVIKYVARCDRKNGLEDLQKARDYLNLLIAAYEEKELQEGLENLHSEEDALPYEDTPKSAMTDEQKLTVREEDTLPYEDTPKSAMTDEQKLTVREATLCYKRVVDGDKAIVKRQDVLEELESMLEGVDYYISSCGDGTTYVELAR